MTVNRKRLENVNRFASHILSVRTSFDFLRNADPPFNPVTMERLDRQLRELEHAVELLKQEATYVE